MKRIFIYMLMALFVTATAYAAGTVVVSSDKVVKISQDESARVVSLLCTGDSSDGSIPDTTLSQSNFQTAATGRLVRPLVGWYLYRVIVENTTSQKDPTANSDVYLKDQDSAGDGDEDYLGGQGVDLLDNDARNKIKLNDVEVFYDDPVLSVDNQDVTAAVYGIELVLVK